MQNIRTSSVFNLVYCKFNLFNDDYVNYLTQEDKKIHLRETLA